MLNMGYNFRSIWAKFLIGEHFKSLQKIMRLINFDHVMASSVANHRHSAAV